MRSLNPYLLAVAVPLAGCGSDPAPSSPSPGTPAAPVTDSKLAENDPRNALAPFPARDCGLKSTVWEDFEQEPLAQSWILTPPAPFAFDTARAVSGQRSLRLTVTDPLERSVLAITLPSVCAVRLSFVVHAGAQFLGMGPGLARIIAPPVDFDLFVDNERKLLISQLNGVMNDVGDWNGFGTLEPDTPTVVVVEIDIAARTRGATAAPVGQKLPPLRRLKSGTTFVNSKEIVMGPVTGIEVGDVHPGHLGTLLVDDLRIE